MFQPWLTRAPRMVAGAWFALAGCLPPAMWFAPSIVRQKDVSTFVVVIALPALAASLAGAWVGAAIVQRQLGLGRAFLRGVGVAGLAFTVFAPLYGMASALLEPGTGPVIERMRSEEHTSE